jgi:hypothetical protein
MQFGFTMKLTHLSPVQYLFIVTTTEAFTYTEIKLKKIH